MFNPLANLQKQSYQTRLRMLWGIVTVLGIILAILWFFSLKKEINNLNQESFLPDGSALGAQSAEAGVVAVERVELTKTSLKIFFNVNNDSDDILNFSTPENIKLITDKENISPMKIYDRQNNPFVSKILSGTRNFGILVFPSVDAFEATLVFQDLYFEKKPETLLQETLELDLEELNIQENLRK